MTIIDVDAHAEPAATWLDAFPSLKQRFPERFPDTDPRFRMDSAEMFAYFVSDDLLRHVPADRRMAIDRLTTPAMEAMFSPDRPADLGYPGASQFHQLVDPARRVGWLDDQGIDVQCIISGLGYTLARAISDPALGQAALEAVNTWMSDAVAGHRDRLLPVTNLRFEDLEWTIGEMTRMRERGSRTFLISAEPVGDIPPHHPDFDRLWSAAEDLGMVAHVHVGMSPASYHPGWANTDDPALIRLISILHPHQTTQVFLNAMVFGGVFERHPRLTVLISELGVDWLPGTVAKMDTMAEPGVSPLILGEYKLPLKPSEYVRRNVRISPLPTPKESPLPLFDSLPEVAVFSSDYPHFEGSAGPIEHYEKELAAIDPAVRDAFLGDNIAGCFARMGDPIL
ncbi:MAG: hypothetical protein JWO37_2824 [Acidimicrobiales bacterium]|jgi:predicted TIM-barrel fold metal-dependent hydrolase|nr:hypothetical protein [Acidimicrobiales bacterium]